MKLQRNINKIRIRRANRVRRKIKSEAQRLRLSVFKSHRYIYAQLIDDASEKTIVSVSSKGMKPKKKTELAREVGKAIAEAAKKLDIQSAVFDRGRYLYHGRVKALAEGAREAGLKMYHTDEKRKRKKIC